MDSKISQLTIVRKKVEEEAEQQFVLEDEYLSFENKYLRIINPVNQYFGIGNLSDFAWFYGILLFMLSTLLVIFI